MMMMMMMDDDDDDDADADGNEDSIERLSIKTCST